MHKYILIILSLCSFINGMETVQKICWDDNHAHDDCSVNTVAHLHILQNSNLNTKNLTILDATCRKGHTARFLANTAQTVYGYDADKTLLKHAKKKSMGNLTFTKKINQENFYNLIVAFAPSTSIDSLQHLHTLLAPNGELFCSFITQSNPLPIAAAASQEILPTIQNIINENRPVDSFINTKTKNKQYPSDELLKSMINKAQFTILSYEQKVFDIEILDKNKFKCFHTSTIMDWSIMDYIKEQKKREEVACLCIDLLISKIKKDDMDNWFYPINTTVIHLRKNDLIKKEYS